MRDFSRAAGLKTQVKPALLWLMRFVRPVLARLPRRLLQSEWDTDVPPFSVLIGEAARAEARRRRRRLVA